MSSVATRGTGVSDHEVGEREAHSPTARSRPQSGAMRCIHTRTHMPRAHSIWPYGCMCRTSPQVAESTGTVRSTASGTLLRLGLHTMQRGPPPVYTDGDRKAVESQASDAPTHSPHIHMTAGPPRWYSCSLVQTPPRRQAGCASISRGARALVSRAGNALRTPARHEGGSASLDEALLVNIQVPLCRDDLCRLGLLLLLHVHNEARNQGEADQAADDTADNGTHVLLLLL